MSTKSFKDDLYFEIFKWSKVTAIIYGILKILLMLPQWNCIVNVSQNFMGYAKYYISFLIVGFSYIFGKILAVIVVIDTIFYKKLLLSILFFIIKIVVFDIFWLKFLLSRQLSIEIIVIYIIFYGIIVIDTIFFRYCWCR